MTAVARACLIDVYDTILTSQFVPRMAAVIEPLGVDLDKWLAEWDTMREDRDRGKGTVAGVLLGVLFLSAVDNGLQLLGLSLSSVYAIKGGVILLAAVTDAIRHNVMARG